MSNILTVMKRDLKACYTSPIGYIFMIVFVLISVGLFITSFFSYPMADMRGFFGPMPILLCIFIPAVTMRVWAEERNENTWEMLLTFPMKAHELVLGKFLACLIFFGLTLAATFTVPLMLIKLGNPDCGTIFGGYLGTFLLGAFFLSIGIFFSGFYKDQIVAFVVTLLACFLVYLVGTYFLAAYIDGAAPGVGTMLSTVLGVTEHYGAFTRGVIEVGDIVYFVAWTAIFLVLNVMFIDGRNRPGARLIFTGAVVMSLAIGLTANWLVAGKSFGRFDLTEDKIYTVSDASVSILSELETPVQVKVYITPKAKMPTGMTTLEQDICDKLEELRLRSGGKIEYKRVHLDVQNVLADPMAGKDDDEEATEEEAIEERMLDKGVMPFSVQARAGADEVVNKLVYSSIGVGYKDKKEEVIPQILPQSLPGLEYRLINTIYKLTRETKPVVALVAPEDAFDPRYRQMLQQMGQQVPRAQDNFSMIRRYLEAEKYDVRRVLMTKDRPLPEEYDTLVVVEPQRLEDRQRWEINRALRAGKSVILAAQNYDWDYQNSRRGMNITRQSKMPAINELLETYGLGLDEDILMDDNSVGLTIQDRSNPLASLFGGGQTLDLPIHIKLSNRGMDPSTSITSRLDDLFFLWGSPLTLDEDKLKELGLKAKVLIETSEDSWTVSKDDTVSQGYFDKPESGLERYPVMAMISGQFPDAYEGKERPEWPASMPTQPGMPPQPDNTPDPPSKELAPAPGKLILLGCSQVFRDNFLQAGNLDLFMNSVDAVTLGDDLVNVRGNKPISRAIDMPNKKTRRFWRAVNYGLSITVIALVGIVSTFVRRRSRNAYTMAYARR